MAITRQDIVDRRDVLKKEESEAYLREKARIKKETDSLQELCGGMGHVFGQVPYFSGQKRNCVYCFAEEP